MTEVTMDANGRITLPEQIRRRLHVRPGDSVILDVGDRPPCDGDEEPHLYLSHAQVEPDDAALQQRLEQALTALAAMEPDPRATGWSDAEDPTAWVETLRQEGEDRLSRIWGEDVAV